MVVAAIGLLISGTCSDLQETNQESLWPWMMICWHFLDQLLELESELELVLELVLELELEDLDCYIRDLHLISFFLFWISS